MSIDRRTFLHLAAAGALGGAAGSPLRAATRPSSGFKAVAFDGFAIFDPRPIAALTQSLFPDKGTDLGKAWRTRQFEYQWLRALTGQYTDFLQTTDDALRFAATSLQLELSAANHSRLMQAYLDLTAWPDVAPTLAALRDADVRLAVLSNMTPRMLDAGIEAAGLRGMFERVLSTDSIRSYKPDPRAYRMAVETLGLRPDEIVFAAFAGWDVSGAKWFGHPTYWVNRLDQPAEELGVAADAAGRDLAGLVSFVQSPR